MPSDLHTRMAGKSLDRRIGRMGVLGSYAAPSGGATVSDIDVLIDEGPPLVVTESGREVNQRTALLRCRSGQVTPERNGAFTLDDTAAVWKVMDDPVLYAGLWECECRNDLLKSQRQPVIGKR